jgi:transposase-like protein
VTLTQAEEGSTRRDRPTHQVVRRTTYEVVRGHQVLEEMTGWMNQPLDEVYPVIFIDAIVVKVRDGQVRNKPIYVVIGVTVNGERDILGLWPGDGSEGAKFWLQSLTELKNRGVADVCIAACDGLKGCRMRSTPSGSSPLCRRASFT